MSNQVFVVSEWLPKAGHEEELLAKFKALLALTFETEDGCSRTKVTKQLSHPGSPGKSQFTIVLFQDYDNIEAFDLHCSMDYVQDFFIECIENEETCMVEDWTCRLFIEA